MLKVVLTFSVLLLLKFDHRFWRNPAASEIGMRSDGSWWVDQDQDLRLRPETRLLGGLISLVFSRPDGSKRSVLILKNHLSDADNRDLRRLLRVHGPSIMQPKPGLTRDQGKSTVSLWK